MRKLVCFFMMLVLCVSLVGCSSAEPTGNQSAATNTASSTSTDTGKTTASTSPQILSEDEVKMFALFCAGTTEKKVTNYQCELTYHKKRDCQVYDISFDVGRVHYAYIFRATDCDIIKNEKTIRDK